jgi:2-polyprenyl-3-methyl-5-hydroxy-6-metoxy-1,4-benzoquinol methylase
MLQLNGVSCPFCSNINLTRYSAQAHDAAPMLVHIVECPKCEVGWQWPLQRTQKQSQSVFNKAYATHEAGSYFDQNRRESVAMSQIDFLKSIGQTEGCLLDMGCGDGTFARHMAQQGWNALGLDPALQSDVTENYPHGELKLRRNNDAELPAMRLFDLVTLWDVVEHVERPDVLIAEAAARLAPGGMLVVETGNYQCLARLQSNHDWWNYQLDHRWYLAPPQLKAFLSSARLIDIQLANCVLRPWWKGASDANQIGARALLGAVARHPFRAIESWRRYQRMEKSRNSWKGWSGLEIMTITARRPIE